MTYDITSLRGSRHTISLRLSLMLAIQRAESEGYQHLAEALKEWLKREISESAVASG